MKRLEGETWREHVARVGGEHGLADYCLSTFDELTDPCEAAVSCYGTPAADDEEAAFAALYEWDCADVADVHERMAAL